ncbi:ORF388 [Staphylococcus phage G1]|uniref:ORF388 n=1 Tax=Staphylococcus phage G1 TaxID=2908166 RepID=Q4Z9X0_9CAUD|nr:ORF388 [Staphylococcus phage G1]AAX92293.1 ORF388 [Staphylococcus phage G1]
MRKSQKIEIKISISTEINLKMVNGCFPQVPETIKVE